MLPAARVLTSEVIDAPPSRRHRGCRDDHIDDNHSNPILSRDALLRLVLKLDAVVTGANGVAYLAAAGPLEDLFGVDAAVQRPIGAFLVLFAVGVWLVATRPAISRGAVMAIAGANALWAIGSLAFAVAGVSSPTTVGTVWIVLQALVVGGFATLQAATAGGAAASAGRTGGPAAAR